MVGRPVGVPRTRRRTERRGRGLKGGREDGVDGDGYPRGKQFLLIQRSHPHGGASLVDPLLDLSPSRSVSFPPFLSRSRIVSLFLSFSLSFALFSFSSRARTWLLRTSAPQLATLDSYPSYPSFPSFPSHRGKRGNGFKVRRSIRSPSRKCSRSIYSRT